MRTLLIFVLLSCFAPASAQEVIPLYPDGKIPLAKPGTEVPQITIFRPQSPATNIAVIVCSGGSYHGRANSVEGIPACKKLAAAGITAFLLDYRVPDSTKMYRKQWVPLTDVQTALYYIRKNARAYHINPHWLGLMGFSAGGHLVSTAGTHFNMLQIDDPDHISVRPDFLVLIYPVISFADSLTHQESRSRLIGPDITPENIRLYSNELQVTEQTPPTFISVGLDDAAVKPMNSLLFAAALRQHHVPVEVFPYASGAHGYGAFNPRAQVQWIDDCIGWIKALNKNGIPSY